jgi:hypothetical protein
VAEDVTIRLPESEPTGPIKDQMYRYRGEIVSIGAAVDWIMHRLDDEFVHSAQPTTARRWDAIKAHLRERGLTNGLQPQLRAVAEYFKARELGAHAAMVIAQVGDSAQVLRLYYDGPTQKIEAVTIEDLKREAGVARAGYEAAQTIGQALDDDLPEVLVGMNPLAKAMLIGRA